MMDMSGGDIVAGDALSCDSFRRLSSCRRSESVQSGLRYLAMGKSVHKYRKNREYDPIAQPSTVSPYDIHDGKGTRHVDDDLLTAPREFIPLHQLIPGDVSNVGLVMIMSASCVGVSSLILPFAFHEGGLAMSISLVVIIGILTHITRTRLVEICVEQGVYSFQGLAYLAYGSTGSFVVGCCQMSVSLGLMVTYLAILFHDAPIVLGHLLKMGFDPAGLPIVPAGEKNLFLKLIADRFWFAEFTGLVIVVPFCLIVNSYKRSRLPAIAVLIVMGAVAVSMVIHIHSYHDQNMPPDTEKLRRLYLRVPSTAVQAFGILAASFASQHHVFHSFYAMQDRSTATFRRLSQIAMLGSLLIALSIGISGYLSFLDNVSIDVIQNYDFEQKRGLLAFWLLMPLAALFCVPYQFIVFRHTCEFATHRSSNADTSSKPDVLFRAQKSASQVVVSQDEEKDVECSGSSTFTAIMSLILIIQFSTFFVHDIARAMSLTGGLGGIALCFVIPPICHLKLIPSDRSGSNWCHEVFLPCLSIGVGGILSIACAAINIVQMWTTHEDD